MAKKIPNSKKNKRSTTTTKFKRPARTPNNPPMSASQKHSLTWATVLEPAPNPKVITSADLRKRIVAVGLPWRVQDKKTGIELLLIPPGTFQMGASKGDKDAEDSEKPTHSVTISKPFYLGRTHVTCEQWILVNHKEKKYQEHRRFHMQGQSLANDPVTRLPWKFCHEFCKKTGFELPTEAQWEYACRAESITPIYGPLGQIAWFKDNCNIRDVPYAVGKKKPNGFGLYDMLGNLEQWCADWFGQNFYQMCKAGVTDPTGPKSGIDRVLRGSIWFEPKSRCRASLRQCGDEDRYTGFRVAKNL